MRIDKQVTEFSEKSVQKSIFLRKHYQDLLPPLKRQKIASRTSGSLLRYRTLPHSDRSVDFCYRAFSNVAANHFLDFRPGQTNTIHAAISPAIYALTNPFAGFRNAEVVFNQPILHKYANCNFSIVRPVRQFHCSRSLVEQELLLLQPATSVLKQSEVSIQRVQRNDLALVSVVSLGESTINGCGRTSIPYSVSISFPCGLHVYHVTHESFLIQVSIRGYLSLVPVLLVPGQSRFQTLCFTLPLWDLGSSR